MSQRQQAQIKAVEAHARSGAIDLYGHQWGDPATDPAFAPVRAALESALRQTANPRVLEIGCGGGRWTDLIRRLSPDADLTLIDGTQSAIDLTQAHLARCGLTPATASAVCPDGELTSWDPFDVVFSFDVFVHFDRPLIDRYLRSIARILRPGGRLLINFACECPDYLQWEKSDEWFEYVIRSHKGRLEYSAVLEATFASWYAPGWTVNLMPGGYGSAFLSLTRQFPLLLVAHRPAGATGGKARAEALTAKEAVGDRQEGGGPMG